MEQVTPTTSVQESLTVFGTSNPLPVKYMRADSKCAGAPYRKSLKHSSMVGWCDLADDRNERETDLEKPLRNTRPADV